MPPSAPPLTASTVLLAQGGDTQAMHEVLRETRELLLKYSHHLCRNQDQAEENIQDALETILKHLSQYRGEAAYSTWVYSIARRLCFKNKQKQAASPTASQHLTADPSEHLFQVDPSPLPEELLMRAEFASELETILAGMDEKYRTVFFFRDMEGLSNEEVAQILEIGVPAVKSRLHRAREFIRESMQQRN